MADGCSLAFVVSVAVVCRLLDSNPLTSIGDGTFSGLSSLKTLYLSYTNLATIKSTTFNGLSGLEQL